MWTATDARLVVTAVAAVALVVVIISRLRLHAYPALPEVGLAAVLVASLVV